MSLKLRNSRRGLSFGVAERNLTFPSRSARAAFSLSPLITHLPFVSLSRIHFLVRPYSREESKLNALRLVCGNFTAFYCKNIRILVCKLAHVVSVNLLGLHSSSGAKKRQGAERQQRESFDMMKAGGKRATSGFSIIYNRDLLIRRHTSAKKRLIDFWAFRGQGEGATWNAPLSSSPRGTTSTLRKRQGKRRNSVA